MHRQTTPLEGTLPQLFIGRMTTLHHPYSSSYPFSSHSLPYAGYPTWNTQGPGLRIPPQYMASNRPRTELRSTKYYEDDGEDDGDDDDDDEEDDDDESGDEEERYARYDDDELEEQDDIHEEGEEEDDEEDDSEEMDWEAERRRLRRRREERSRHRPSRSTRESSSTRRPPSQPMTTTPNETDGDVGVSTGPTTTPNRRERYRQAKEHASSRAPTPGDRRRDERKRQMESEEYTSAREERIRRMREQEMASRQDREASTAAADTVAHTHALGVDGRTMTAPPNSDYMMSGAIPETATTTPAVSSVPTTTTPNSTHHNSREASSRGRTDVPSNTHVGPSANSTAPTEGAERSRSRAKGNSDDTALKGRSTRDTKMPSSTPTDRRTRSSQSPSSSSAPRKVDERWKQLARRTSTATSLFDLSSSLYGLRAEEAKGMSEKSRTWINDQARKRLGALKLDKDTDLSTALSSTVPDISSKLTLDSLATSLLKPMRDYRNQRYTKALKGDDESAKSTAKEGMKKEEAKYAAAMKGVQSLAKTLAKSTAASATAAGRKRLYTETREFVPREDGRDDVTITRKHADGRTEVTHEVRDTPVNNAPSTSGTKSEASKGESAKTVDEFVLQWWKDKMSQIA